MRIGASALLATAFLSTTPAQEALAPFDAPQLAFPYWTSVTSVGDLDGDGDIDALGWYWRWANRFDVIRLRTWLNDGSGAFQAGQEFQLSGTGGQNTSWDTEIGNLHSGAGADVAVAFDRTVTTYIRLAGSLQPFATWNEPFAVADLVLADFDGDGLDDLALVGAAVKVYRNTVTGLTPVAAYPLAGSEIHAGDFDSDGAPDFLVPTAGGVTMLRYQQGTLQVIGNYSHGVQAAEHPMTVVGDSDADGDDDVVVFTEAGEYVTLRCIGPAQFVVESRVAGGPATGLADVDGDGDLDGVCCGGGGPAPAVNNIASTFHVSINLGGGRFARAYSVAGLGALRLAGAVDVDGDGDRDLVAGRAVWFNQGGFAVDPQPDLPVTPTATQPMHPATFTDADGDGDPDVAHRGGFAFRNDGAGNFEFVAPVLPSPPAGTTYGREGYRGDFDGDGDEDLILAHESGQTLLGMRLFYNTGGGGYTDGGYALQGVAFSHDPAPDGWDRLHAVGDLDGDGDLDIAQGHTQGVLDVVIWWNDGLGRFQRGPSFLSGVPQAICDLDLDGHMDLVTHKDRWFGDGLGGFTRAGGFAGRVDPDGDHMAVTDVDGDGLIDVAMYDRSANGYVLVYYNNGNRVFQQRAFYQQPGYSRAPRGIDIADFDGDGIHDLMIWPGSFWEGIDTATVLFGDGNRRFFTRRSTTIMQVGGPVADLDGDGDMDVFGKGIVRGARRQAFGDGYRQQFGLATAGPAGFAPTLGAVGPFHSGAGLELSVTGAPGASLVVLGLGAGPARVPDWPLPGLIGYVSPLAVTVGALASGNPGEPGTGSLTLAAQVPAVMAGSMATLQAWAFDAAAPGGLVLQTNGLFLAFR